MSQQPRPPSLHCSPPHPVNPHLLIPPRRPHNRRRSEIAKLRREQPGRLRIRSRSEQSQERRHQARGGCADGEEATAERRDGGTVRRQCVRVDRQEWGAVGHARYWGSGQ